jgi:hypothetical protein
VANEYRCFHSRTAEEQEEVELVPGISAEGVVVCQHVYGIGVYVPDLKVWGHVNVTEMGVEKVGTDFRDHPAIGARLTLRVLGRTPDGQLRLAVV